MARESFWAVILAGGDGNRLRPLTRYLSGDDRPKQFCRLVGSRSLLADTMQRMAPIIARDRMLCLVSKGHEAFYRADVAALRPWQVLEQPARRGTTAAIAYAVAIIQANSAHEAGPVVGFIPADHHYSDTAAFQRALSLAYAEAARYPDRVVMLGAGATKAETEYGWIQPGPRLVHAPNGTRAPTIHEVDQFWEKPSADVAGDLLERHCLWNTFLSVGRVGAFASLLNDVVPELWSHFAALGRLRGHRHDAATLEAIYAAIDASDFSRDVLSKRPGRLAVIELPATAGWTDLGHPGRALDLLARHHLPRPALRWAPQTVTATKSAPLDAA